MKRVRIASPAQRPALSPPLPGDEARRLAALHSHEILGTVAEPAFERVVRLAARFFAMPMAAISFVDEFRVWCKASHGLTSQESAREDSFCAHTILQREVLIVRDARLDERFNSHLFGNGPRAARFYAGAPLRTADGHALGALCVMDTAPRVFTPEDEGTLADMASLVVDELLLRRLTDQLRAKIDEGLRTRRALTRQHRLLRRLSDSLEDRIRLRTGELTTVNQALRAEITHRRHADAALHHAKAEAERANDAKSDFLSRLSHELRTPLNAILGFGQILQGPLPAEEQRDCAGQVVTAGRHLLSLINELLDTARIEAGLVDLALEPVRISDVVGEAFDLLRPIAADRRIKLETSGEMGAGRTVLADRQRLKQVLLNLLANAVKYSPETGSVAVTCRVERGRSVRVSVIDDGPGIAREQAGRLFVAFDRLGAERSGVQGTGLGLSLSKRFVEAMGGTIGVAANARKGSTFWVRLPLWSARAPVMRETAAADAYRRNLRVSDPHPVELHLPVWPLPSRR